MATIVVWNNTQPKRSESGLKSDFTVEQPGRYAVFFTGSAYSKTTKQIGAQLKIGSFQAIAHIWANEANSHKALVPVVGELDLAIGTHVAEAIAANAESHIDHNDFFTLTLTKVG